MFSNAGREHRIIGEGSTSYLRNERALREIAIYSPSARIVAMLRNPVDLVYAFHSELLKHYLETEPDFEKAWRLQDDRAAGRYIPTGANRIEPLFYGNVGRLGSQVDRLYEIFPESQILLIFHDDFRSDPRSAYLSVLKHLDLPDDGRSEFPVFNRNAVIQRSLLLRVLKENQLLRYFSSLLKGVTGKRSWGIVTELQRRGKVSQPRQELRVQFRAELAAYFKPEVLKLQELTGRDLRHWLM